MDDQFDDRWSWAWIFHKVLASGEFPDPSSHDIEPLWRRWWKRHSSEREQIELQLLAAEHHLYYRLPADLVRWEYYSNLGRRQCQAAWRYDAMRRNRLDEHNRQGRLHRDQRRRLQAIHAEVAALGEAIAALSSE